jgi:hypothetical protein
VDSFLSRRRFQECEETDARRRVGVGAATKEAEMRRTLDNETCLLSAFAVFCYAAALAATLACCCSLYSLALPSLERGVVAVVARYDA